MKIFLNWLSSESGVTAVEYGLFAAGIALAIVGTFFSMGDSLELMFGTMSTALTDAASQIDIGP
jgi:Flp pilus assembly pilin Flp